MNIYRDIARIVLDRQQEILSGEPHNRSYPLIIVARFRIYEDEEYWFRANFYRFWFDQRLPPPLFVDFHVPQTDEEEAIRLIAAGVQKLHERKSPDAIIGFNPPFEEYPFLLGTVLTVGARGIVG